MKRSPASTTGMELPVIMQWLKRTLAQRYNALIGRTGHISGDRY
jgi:hypothetical protein